MKLLLTIFVLMAGFGVITEVGAFTVAPCHCSTNNSELNNSEMNQEEIWKDVVGYEGLYQVSNLGRIKSLYRQYIRSNGWRDTKQEKILSLRLSMHGYYLVDLHNDNTKKTVSVHRLKAIAFIPNPKNKPCINHRDSVRSNNGFNSDGKDNLEWCTYSENSKHAYDKCRMNPPNNGVFGKDHPKSKAILQFDLSNNFISEFGGQREAKRLTGINQGMIGEACRGIRKSVGGYIWKFKDTES